MLPEERAHREAGSSRLSGSPAGWGWLLVCFFLSGLAALVYQTAWTRQFAFVFGTSELAVASVLAAYMGGLAAGAAIAARFVGAVRRPLLVYGLLEAGIALAALLVPPGVRAARALYVTIFGSRLVPADEGGLLTALFYLTCGFAILLVPTSLMGATLPLLARHAVRSGRELGRRIGLLYAVNTVGAVTGTLLTGFVLLPALGLRQTVFVAVATNGLVFAAAVLLARSAAPLTPEPDATARSAQRATRSQGVGSGRWILPLIAISGAVSFTYEVLWTRLLGHVLGGSVYAFATMLATFLAGIAIGSFVAGRSAGRDRQTAGEGFAWVQVGAGLLSLVAYALLDLTPGWIRSIGAQGDLRMLADVVVAAAILLPGAIALGATYPLAVRVLARDEHDAAAASARVYAWNTVGAIAGAVGAGFFWIPAVGFAASLATAVGANLVLAGIAALAVRPRLRSPLFVAAAGLAFLVVLPPEPPWTLLRTATTSLRDLPGETIYHGVGRSASVLLKRVPGGWRLSSNGLSESMIHPPGVRPGRFVLARLLGSLPTLGQPGARSMLVVGFGGGLVVEAAPPSIERIEVIELEPEILAANQAIASLRKVDPLSDPRLHVTVNDARNALFLTQERFDAVVSQPSHPWTAGASHLYTREFFDLVRQHLTPEGVFVQWMGLGFVDEPLIQSLVATLLDVFPHVRVYRPVPGGILFSASLQPFEPERNAAVAVAAAPGLFAEMGIHGPADVAVYTVLEGEGLRRFARGAPVITDDRNLLQMRSPGILRSGENARRPDLFAEHDSLVRRLTGSHGGASGLGVSREYLVRRVVVAGFLQRAERIAAVTSGPASRAVADGVVARARGDLRAARRHFEAALDREPSSDEARIALLEIHRQPATRMADSARAFFELAAEARGSSALLLRGWKLEATRDFDGLRAKDPALAAVRVHDPGFAAATRLRVAWRLEGGGVDGAREAVALVDAMTPIGGTLSDLVLGVRASARAGYLAGARSSLVELLRRLDGNPAQRPVVQEAIDVLEELPEQVISDASREALRRQLTAKRDAR